MQKAFSESELILRKDGSVYHLGVRAEDLAQKVIIVGDPERVGNISSRFDSIRVKKSSREFHIHTGTLNSSEITVVSTGIGVDNIDIVINEIDAAVNINPDTRTLNDDIKSFQFLRLGTSGALNAEIRLHDVVASAAAIGMDGVPYFYNYNFSEEEQSLAATFQSSVNWPVELAKPYAVYASSRLLDKFSDIYNHKGITITANGFYGPQNRQLRAPLKRSDLENAYSSFRCNGLEVTNFEMETSGIYALSKMLNHEHLTMCVILANRINKEFSSAPDEAVNKLIDSSLESFSI